MASNRTNPILEETLQRRAGSETITAFLDGTDLNTKMKQSAVVKQLLLDLGEEESKKQSTVWFSFPGDKPLDLFLKGAYLGRLAKQSLVTWAATDTSKHYFFLGNESDIIRRLKDLLPEDT